MWVTYVSVILRKLYKSWTDIYVSWKQFCILNKLLVLQHGRVRSPEEDMEDEGEDLSIDEPNCVTLEPRSIRIGSLRLNNFSPVMFRKDGIFFTVEGEAYYLLKCCKISWGAGISLGLLPAN